MGKLTDGLDACWIGSGPRMGEEDLRQWCAARNASRLAEDAGWWYYVYCDDSGRHVVDKLEGWKATEARARANRQPIKWYTGTPEDMAAIHAYVAKCMAQGMTQQEFNTYVRKTGGCPRVR